MSRTISPGPEPLGEGHGQDDGRLPAEGHSAGGQAAVVDAQFSDPRLAALHDLSCPWDARGDFTFYPPFVMAVSSVLDVGCGTGALLRRAREDGQTGRLRGLDPAAAPR
ncbi:hypothetical protein [Streptomyces sp. YKOK-I1]